MGTTRRLENPGRVKAVYMKSDKTRFLSVLRADMRLPAGLVPDVRTEYGSAVDSPLMTGDDAPPDVVGVPKGTFS